MSRASRVRRWLAAGVVVALIVLGSGRPVSAHASLLTTNPAADSVLDIAPGEIVLTFTEPVDPTDEAIRLVTADGTPVQLGPVTQDRGSASLSAAITGELADGSYVVAWSAVSNDSHPISGAFVFSVGAPSRGAEDLIGDVLGDTTAEPGSDLLLTAGRFASYAGIAALIGTLAAAVIVAPSIAESSTTRHCPVRCRRPRHGRHHRDDLCPSEPDRCFVRRLVCRLRHPLGAVVAYSTRDRRQHHRTGARGGTCSTADPYR